VKIKSKNLLITFLLFGIVGMSMSALSQDSEKDANQNTEQKNQIDKDFQKLIDESKQLNISEQNSLKNDVKIESIKEKLNTQPTIKASEKTYPKTKNEILITFIIGGLFLLLNFICSISLPKYRYLFIGVPFDLGVKEVKTNAQSTVKRKRNFIELFLLTTVSILFYFVAISERSSPNQIITDTIIEALIYTGIGYLSYIVVRIFWGLSSKCPKCKNMFAVSANSYKEPKSTFEQRGSVSRKQHPFQSTQQVDVYEIGVNHTDHSCNVCGHLWHTANNYKNHVSTHHVDV
jgi:biopolymer transport protein ExbB/TolQ